MGFQRDTTDNADLSPNLTQIQKMLFYVIEGQTTNIPVFLMEITGRLTETPDNMELTITRRRPQGTGPDDLETHHIENRRIIYLYIPDPSAPTDETMGRTRILCTSLLAELGSTWFEVPLAPAMVVKVRFPTQQHPDEDVPSHWAKMLVPTANREEFHFTRMITGIVGTDAEITALTNVGVSTLLFTEES